MGMDNVDKVTKALVVAKIGRQESESKNGLWRLIEGREEDPWEKEKAALERKHREREMKREKERLKYKKKYENKQRSSDVSTGGSGSVQNNFTFGARDANRGGVKFKEVENDAKSRGQELRKQRDESSCCII